MITDIFARRYADVPLRTQYFQDDQRLMTQASAMIMDPLWIGRNSEKTSPQTEANLKAVHDILALELGREYLSERYWFQNYTMGGDQRTHAHTYGWPTICKAFLTKVPDDLTKGDTWVKERLSLIELAFGRRWKQIHDANLALAAQVVVAEMQDAKQAQRSINKIPGQLAQRLRNQNASANEAFEALVRDLNERLRLALYNLTFHNGLLQLAEDQAINVQVARPFWALVSDPQWTSVEEQMKEAVDRRDRGDRTAAFHAVCALESCIKIISDVKGWTRGIENGAANYIDNLVSKANGQFLDVWEGELLTKMFGDVRNPFAHGPGQSPLPKLSPEQTDWAVDTAMSWIRNLIRRL